MPNPNLHPLITATTLHLRVHCYVDNEHRLHLPALQMRHLHSHPTTSPHLHKQHTPTKANLNTSPHLHKQHTPSKTNLNWPSEFSITEENQQHVPKSADGTRVKRSKQQTKQTDEHLCFHCNLPGHLK